MLSKISRLEEKGRDLVRDKLLRPNLVPDGISTLKIFFGRLEHTFEGMVEKVRRLEPPNGRLDALIE